MNKIVAKPVTIGTSMLAGIVAGAVFKRVWKLTAGDRDTPDATDFERGWAEVLVAAAMEGAIFGAVKAGVQRMTASRPETDEES